MVAQNKVEQENGGYPRIEALIDNEDFDSLNVRLATATKELDKIAKLKSGLKKGKQAKKSVEALALTVKLLEELLELKYQEAKK